MRNVVISLAMAIGFIGVAVAADKERVIGKVSSGFQIIGPNHGIKVVQVSDPLIPQVSCYISFSENGGVSGLVRDITGVSISHERNEMSVACRKMISVPPARPRKSNMIPC